MTVPSTWKKIVRFGKAWRRWSAAAKRPERWTGLPGIVADEKNRPVRTDEAIRELFEICSANHCGHYIIKDDQHGQCELCGCRLNLTGRINKFYLATESCPADPPHWTSPIQLSDDEVKQEPEKIEIEPTEKERRMMEAREQQAKMRKERQARQSDSPAKTLTPREQRKKERDERIQRRQERMASQPPEYKPPVNDDQLEMFGRDMQPIGHALRDLWAGAGEAAFLVCGGPSTKDVDMGVLQERGIVSLGVNNVAAYYHTSAFICGDPPAKFHHGIFFDESMLKFIPQKRLRERVRVKMEDGTFRTSSRCVRHCPGVYGYRRDAEWEPETFLTSKAATWGCGQSCVDKTKRPKILFTFFSALRMMHYLGVRRVYMLGVDFMMSPEQGYSFDQARWPGAARGNNNHYRIAAPMCEELLPVFAKAEFEVYNCYQKSSLRAFAYVPFDEAVEDCRGLVPSGPLDCIGWYEKMEDRGET